jgi:tRNA pseudouridine55 synthase
METPFHEGKLLLMDKPFGWTSFDLVNKVRISIERHYRLKRLGIKVGHAGTLDPLATGLMLICTGKMTRGIAELQGMEKEYTGTFFIGATSASFDQEKPADAYYAISHITEAMLHEKAATFLGVQEQLPPLFSAKQIDGKRAYEFARSGQLVALKSHTIDVSSFEITRIALPYVDFRVVCSKGTYIRSLARDFGQSLGSGAMLSELKRTRIGSFHLSKAIQDSEGVCFFTNDAERKPERFNFYPVSQTQVQ